MDPITIGAISSFAIKMFDLVTSKGYTPTAEDLAALDKARKGLVAAWDALAPKDPPAGSGN